MKVCFLPPRWRNTRLHVGIASHLDDMQDFLQEVEDQELEVKSLINMLGLTKTAHLGPGEVENPFLIIEIITKKHCI